MLSLAKIDRAIIDVLDLPELFSAKPVLMRAYQTARRKLPNQPHSNDYVTRAEFRYLLVYLVQYYEYWIGFEEIDNTRQRKITKTDLEQAAPLLKSWGIKDSPDDLFKQIDTHNYG